MYHYGYMLPSDASLRLDLISLLNDDLDKSQIEKEKYEESEERDEELRKKYNKWKNNLYISEILVLFLKIYL